jgi:hypothetical protein
MGDIVYPIRNVANFSPAIPLILAWISGNCATETKRSLGLSIAVSLGNSIPIALPWSFPSSSQPEYYLGLAVCTGMIGFGCMLAGCLHVYLRWENRRSDQEYGTSTGKERVEGDEDVRFRYVL